MRSHQKIFNEASRFAIVRLAQELLAVSVALAFALAPILASAEEEPEEPDHYLGDGHVDPEEDEAADLARAVQNPVADLISVPFQNNTNFLGPGDWGAGRWRWRCLVYRTLWQSTGEPVLTGLL